MKSLTTVQFWNLYDALPEEVQHRADKAYELWQINPQAHSLYFKRVGKEQQVYSVRIGKGYRATGILQKDVIIWFWIGHHDIYDRLLRNL
jgi:hypothetical protein